MRGALAAAVYGVMGLYATPLLAQVSCEPGLQAMRDGGPQVLTLKEAAAFLRLGESGLVDAAARGEVPGRRILGSWRFSRAALVAWLAGADRPAECFEGGAVATAPDPPVLKPGAPLPDADVSSRDMARITATGRAGGPGPELAQAPEPALPTAEAPPDEEPGRFGEEPEVETAREVALREEAVLGRRGLLQLEADLGFARQEIPVQAGTELEQETLSGALTARYALSERFQLQVGGALLRRSGDVNQGFVELEDQPNETFFGDVVLGARYQLLREEPGLPAVFLTGDAAIPTDGSDAFGFGGSLALTKRFDPTTVFGSLGYLKTSNAENRGLFPDDQITSTLGFIFVMNDRLAFRTALDGVFFPASEARGVDLRTDERFDLSFSMPAVLSESLSLEPSVSFGLDEGPGNRFGLGLSLISSFSVPGLF